MAAAPEDCREKGESALNHDYVKAILYAYPSLGEIAAAVKVAAQNKALLSYKDPRPALDTAEEIAREIATKEAVASLCALVEKMMGELSEEENYLLEYKYFRRRRVLRERYADFYLCCSERNYFRKQNRLLGKAAEIFLRCGWTKERFLAETNGLFTRVMEAIDRGEEGKVRPMRKRGRPHSSMASS